MSMKEWRNQNAPQSIGTVITVEAEEVQLAQENLKDELKEFKEFIDDTNVFIEFTAIVLRDMSLTFFTYDDDLYNCYNLDQIEEAVEKGKKLPKDVMDIFDEGKLVGAFDNEKFDGKDSVYFANDGIVVRNSGEFTLLPYQDISKVNATTSGIDIFMQDNEGNEGTVTISRSDHLGIHLIAAINKFLIAICSKDYYLVQEKDNEEMIEEIINEKIDGFVDSVTCKIYKEDDFFDNEKKLNNALHSYARKVRRNDVVAFIDTSFFSNGKDGLLFTKEGFALDFAFEKTFIAYKEIHSVKIKKKNLVFYGHFSEMSLPSCEPSISDNYYDIGKLKEFIEEIMLYA